MFRFFRWSLALVAVIAAAGCGDEAPAPSARSDPADSRKPAAVPAGPVRKAVAAGRFYPADESELRRTVTRLLKDARHISHPGPVIGVTAPHAGYVFSGEVAAAALKQLSAKGVQTVILVGGHGGVRLGGASVYPKGSYETPLGRVAIDEAVARDIIASSKRVRYVPSAHKGDHALEALVPFIQVHMPAAKIVPVQVWTEDAAVIDDVAQAIARAMAAPGRKCVIVNSTDLAHYPDYETAKVADTAYMKAVVTLDARKILAAEKSLRARHKAAGLECAACGTPGVAVTVAACSLLGVKRAAPVMYRSSGDAAGIGDRRRVVGYGAIAYFGGGRPAALPLPPKVKEGPMKISAEGRKRLLAIARESIALGLAEKAPPVIEPTEELARPAGVFVTLKKGRQLRGCIGIFEADKPVWKQVAEYARISAFRDPRFPPLQQDELDDVWIEISVLTEPKPIDDPMDIQLGVHGIWIIGTNGRRGTYLPQVATEHNMSKEEFLSSCSSSKAGLAPDAWKDPAKAKVLTYTAEVFSEKDPGGQ